MRNTSAPAALAAVVLAMAANLAAPAPAPAPASSAAAPPAAGPTAFTVDTTSDAVDADPSDGRCRTASGACSLRAAVMAANARPGSTITLPPGRYRLTIPPDPLLIIGSHPDPTTGDLNVDAPTTIQGSGARSTVIDANRLDRAFRMRADTRLSDLTITGGSAKQRELPFTDTAGGAIANEQHMTLRRVAVTGNSAGYGGGIFNIPDSHLDLIDSTVSGNVAGEAGGIRFDDSGTVTNSTIADNRVTDPGDRPGSLGGYGGGIDIRGLGPVEILNSTITGNRSSDGGGGINIAPAYLDSLPRPIPDILDLPLGRLTLRNSLVANNTVNGTAADCEKAFATIASQGHNIDSDGSCRLTAVGDLPSRTPLLGPLADNGGPTDTAALLPGSPALDAADECPATDQRGMTRPQGAACDIGAYEAPADSRPSSGRASVHADEVHACHAPPVVPVRHTPQSALHVSEPDCLFPMDPVPPLMATPRRLPATTTAHWVPSAATGDPNGPGISAWPRRTPGRDRIQVPASDRFALPTRCVTDHHCTFWQPFAALRGAL